MLNIVWNMHIFESSIDMSSRFSKVFYDIDIWVLTWEVAKWTMS